MHERVHIARPAADQVAGVLVVGLMGVERVEGRAVRREHGLPSLAAHLLLGAGRHRRLVAGVERPGLAGGEIDDAGPGTGPAPVAGSHSRTKSPARSSVNASGTKLPGKSSRCRTPVTSAISTGVTARPAGRPLVASTSVEVSATRVPLAATVCGSQRPGSLIRAEARPVAVSIRQKAVSAPAGSVA